MPRNAFITYRGGTGNDVVVFVNAPPPQVGTGAPTIVTGTGATLTGQVLPNGTATQAFFEYGTTTLYTNTTPLQNLGSGTTVVDVNEPISGLTPGLTYHYRLVAINPGGRTNGNDVTFVAMAGSGGGATAPPVVNTTAATAITTTTAVLNGTVNPNGGATTAQFQFGTAMNYGSFTVSLSPGNGTAEVGVAIPVSGLDPGTVYHYRLLATNSEGTSTGLDGTFTTSAAAPTVTTGGPAIVAGTGRLWRAP